MATSSPITTPLPSTPLTAEPTTSTPATTPTQSSAVQAISSVVADATSSSPSNTAAFKTIYVTVTATPTANGDQTIDGSGLDDGAVVGIAFGGIVILALVGALIFRILKRRRKTRSLVEIPSSTGSRGNITDEKSSSDALWHYQGQGSEGINSSNGTIYEMEVPAPKAVVKRPELAGRSAPRDLERGLSLIDSRHIISRGRPVRRGHGSTRYSVHDL